MATPFLDLPLDRSKKTFRLWKFSQSVLDDAESEKTLVPRDPTTNPYLDIIQLELAVFDRTQCPKYVALSYEWGSMDSIETIQVNTIPLIITKNLHNFIKTLATDKTYLDRWFWADQISMDQSNIHERDHQVGLMGHIYSDAEFVFAYLGQEGNKSFTANVLENLRLWPHKTPKDESVLACLEVLTRSYWSRLWIVQEIRLARRVVFWCGNLRILRDDLYSLARFMKLESREVLNKVLLSVTNDQAEEIRKRGESFHRDAASLWALLQEP